MSDPQSNFDAARAFAEFGLAKRATGARESASGPGSSQDAARPALQLLRRTLRQRPIRTVLDLGCGDWNWMQALGLPGVGQDLNIRYEGWDASPDLIAELTARHGQPGQIDFALRDITTAPLPQVDLIIARDVLFHLPLPQSVPLVARLRQSCRFFLSTSFLTEPDNSDIEGYLPIEGWGFYRINLNAAPFDLGGQMEEAVREPLCSHKGRNRYACLYGFPPDQDEATPGSTPQQGS